MITVTMTEIGLSCRHLHIHECVRLLLSLFLLLADSVVHKFIFVLGHHECSTAPITVRAIVGGFGFFCTDGSR